MRAALNETSRRGALPLVVLLLGAAALSGCEEEPAPPPSFPFTFTVSSDGDPLEGVPILVNGQPLDGATNAEGVLQRPLVGPPGTQVSIQPQCPEGHRNPEQPTVQTLRQITSLDTAVQARGVEVSFTCPPEHRDAVVVVRALEQADLPVYVDGREVARTDESGAAHVHVRMAPQTSFQVRIATASNPRLRPQDPAQTFQVPDHDAVFVFNQSFEEERPRRRRRWRRRSRPEPSRPRLPVRIGGRR